MKKVQNTYIKFEFHGENNQMLYNITISYLFIKIFLGCSYFLKKGPVIEMTLLNVFTIVVLRLEKLYSDLGEMIFHIKTDACPKDKKDAFKT